MLGNLANMAAREIDTPVTNPQPPLEWFTNGIAVRPKFRRITDKYHWVVFLIDTTKPRWPILYVNPVFHGMTGKSDPKQGTFLKWSISWDELLSWRPKPHTLVEVWEMRAVKGTWCKQ